MGTPQPPAYPGEAPRRPPVPPPPPVQPLAHFDKAPPRLTPPITPPAGAELGARMRAAGVSGDPFLGARDRASLRSPARRWTLPRADAVAVAVGITVIVVAGFSLRHSGRPPQLDGQRSASPSTSRSGAPGQPGPTRKAPPTGSPGAGASTFPVPVTGSPGARPSGEAPAAGSAGGTSGAPHVGVPGGSVEPPTTRPAPRPTATPTSRRPAPPTVLPPVVIKQPAPPPVKVACSLPSTRSVRVTFVNASAGTLRLDWSTFSCGRQAYAVLPPGSSITVSTWVGHSWAIVDYVSDLVIGSRVIGQSKAFQPTY